MIFLCYTRIRQPFQFCKKYGVRFMEQPTMRNQITLNATESPKVIRLEKEYVDYSLDTEKAALARLITDFNQFFNFVNLQGSWYRWVSGVYQISKYDSIGETLCKYLTKYCEHNHLQNDRALSTSHVIVISHRGVYYIFRTLDGKPEYAATSFIDYRPKARIIPWTTLVDFIQSEFEKL